MLWLTKSSNQTQMKNLFLLISIIILCTQCNKTRNVVSGTALSQAKLIEAELGPIPTLIVKMVYLFLY